MNWKWAERISWDMLIFLSVTSVTFTLAVHQVSEQEYGGVLLRLVVQHSKRPENKNWPNPGTVDLGCLGGKDVFPALHTMASETRLRVRLCGSQSQFPDGVEVIGGKHVESGKEVRFSPYERGAVFLSDTLDVLDGANRFQLYWRLRDKKEKRFLLAEIIK